MKKLGVALLIYLGLASAALAQRVQSPGVMAIACAFSTVEPTLTSGWFGYAQCNNKGELIVSSTGGGGGAVTIADGADITQGALADAATTSGGAGSLSAKLRLMTTQLATLNTTLGTPFQAGGSIGNTSFAVTNAGTFAVQAAQSTAANLNATVVGTGTFATQSAQSGIWTVQPGNTANTTPWLFTGSGTAGTAASGVLTVQGISSMTKLLVTPDSVALPANQSVNVSQINAVTPLMGNGTTGTGSQRVTIASDNTAFSVNATATNAGTFAVQSQPTPVTSGGLSVYNVQPAASDNHIVIKAGAGQVYKIEAFNNSATVNYVRLYNATTGFNGCNSASNLVWQGIIPASTSGAGLSTSWELGMPFATGVSICVTSGYATNDTTNATASALVVNVGYK